MLRADDGETPLSNQIAINITAEIGGAVDLAVESLRRMKRTPTMESVSKAHQLAAELATMIARSVGGEANSCKATMADFLVAMDRMRVSHLTLRQSDMIHELARTGGISVEGVSLRTARQLEAMGHVRIADNGSAGWWVELV